MIRTAGVSVTGASNPNAQCKTLHDHEPTDFTTSDLIVIGAVPLLKDSPLLQISTASRVARKEKFHLHLGTRSLLSTKRGIFKYWYCKKTI